MFPKKSFSKRRTIFWLLSVSLILTSCRIPEFQIKNVTVYPEPVVGQVVDLHVEITSMREKDLVKLKLEVPPTIHVVSGDTTWQGAMAANQIQSLDVSLCVIQEGSFPMTVYMSSWSSGGIGTGGNSEIIGIHSTINSGELIRETKEMIRYSQTDEATKYSTPLAITISPECSGRK